MTPRELAEKIHHCFCMCGGEKHTESIVTVESLLSSALEEAKREQHDFEMKLTRPFVLKGKQEAYLDAAKIAETARYAAGMSQMGGALTACEVVAEKIRAKAKDLK